MRRVRRRAWAAAVAAIGSWPVAAVAAGIESCVDIASDADRLACYDRAAGRGAVVPASPVADAAPAAPPPAAAPAPSAVPAAAPARPVAAGTPLPVPRPSADAGAAPSGWFQDDNYKPQTFVQRWELDPESQDGIFRIKAYQPVYLLPVSWRRNVNVDPCSPNPVNCAPGAGAQDLHTEAKFQLSLKTKVLQDILDTPIDLWAAYTQQSYWQVYAADNSRPFRETVYQPEFWFTLPVSVGPEDFRWRMLNLGLVHQSNGQSDPLSRSWNRLYATFGFEAGNMSLFVKPFWRLTEESSTDNNPDISEYAGRIELQAVYSWRANVFSARLLNNLRFGSNVPNRSSLQVDWAFPLYGDLHGYVQGFAGYGDTLQNYNFRNVGIGIGFSLVEWR